MTLYVKSGNTINLSSDQSFEVFETLPAKNYIVKYNEMAESHYLEELEEFTFPEKLYGDVDKVSARIIKAFDERNSNTGILLSGEKGSGKTMLSKKICSTLLKQGIPTLIISSSFSGTEFNTFMQMINQPCVVLFDEFEKIYKKSDDQTQLLSIFDGAFSKKMLFILTVNKSNHVSEFFFNRPGRILYNIKYDGLSQEFITEYAKDNLKDLSKLNDLQEFCETYFRTVNFDMLQALIEEMNRFNESPIESAKYLNIRSEEITQGFYSIIEVHKDNVLLMSAKTYYEGIDDTLYLNNDMAGEGDLVSNIDDWKLTLSPTDIFKLNLRNQHIIYRTDDGYQVTVKRDEKNIINAGLYL